MSTGRRPQTASQPAEEVLRSHARPLLSRGTRQRAAQRGGSRTPAAAPSIVRAKPTPTLPRRPRVGRGARLRRSGASHPTSFPRPSAPGAAAASHPRSTGPAELSSVLQSAESEPEGTAGCAVQCYYSVRANMNFLPLNKAEAMCVLSQAILTEKALLFLNMAQCSARKEWSMSLRCSLLVSTKR